MGIIQAYEIHTAGSKADALAYIERRAVEENHCYVFVETPEGNWGKDIMGFFEE